CHLTSIRFLCSGYLRVLPSFPTRRSSDLEALDHVVRDHRARQILEEEAGLPFVHVDRYPAELAGLERFDHRLGVDQTAAARIDQDRKSTRLNSSHGSISYAVFCLKKKKII